MLNKVFFIVGPPRSGSTLIYNSICSKEIFNIPLPETHLANGTVKNFYNQLTRNERSEKKFFFENYEKTKNYFNECLDIFFNSLAKRYNVDFLVLKSIILSPNINVLHEIYPQISYLMIVRDPRDIIVSMIKVGINQESHNLPNQFPRNIENLCKIINRSYRLCLDNQFNNFISENVYFFKYENFIDSPFKELNEFCKFFSLKIEYSDELNAWKRTGDIYNDENYKSDLWGKPISSERIGSYNNFLDKKEIELINQNCKKILNYFNYE